MHLIRYIQQESYSNSQLTREESSLSYNTTFTLQFALHFASLLPDELVWLIELRRQTPNQYDMRFQIGMQSSDLLISNTFRAICNIRFIT